MRRVTLFHYFHSPEDYENGDTVNGNPSSFHHYVEVIVKEVVPVEVPHKCMTVNLDVTLEVVDDVSTSLSAAFCLSCLF